MDHIPALIALLDDADPAVQAPLIARLGTEPELLDRTWQVACAGAGEPPPVLVDLVLRADAEALIDAFADADDLDAGVWLLPRLHRPRTDHRTPGVAAIAALAARLPADADGGTVAAFLSGDCAFAGDQRAYDDPLNSHLPWVLERRLGLPIALTALWLLVCRRQGCEAHAVALPGHVLGRWPGGYVDLFASGRAVTRDELDARARAHGEASAAPYLAAASDRALLRRMARNLVQAYLRRGDPLRATIAHGLATA